MANAATNSSESILPQAALQSLIDLLIDEGYQVIGPRIDQGAIVYGELTSADDLPCGWTDRQEAGTYRLERRSDDARFGYVVGPHSWKRYLFPPLTTVSTADRTEAGWRFQTPDEPPPRYAFLGVRACELAAMRVQDRVFMGGAYVDPAYRRRREAALIIAVNCTLAAPTCFCSSMETGPRCEQGFDLALTEIDAGFLIESGSDRGNDLLGRLPTRTASDAEQTRAEQARQQAVDQMQRSLDTEGIRELLQANLEHPQWEEIGKRCLSCTNCTMVCPTCFCTTVEDSSSLDGATAERTQRWDSCFTVDFSYIHGGSVRSSPQSRYRQWMTHKLATWWDQFDTSGCVGCGRCITWCPVGIDITEEARAIREEPARETAS